MAAEKVELYCRFLGNNNREFEAQELRMGHVHVEGMHVSQEIAICYNITLHVHAVKHKVSYKYGAGESEVHLWWGLLNGTEHYQLMVFKADFPELTAPDNKYTPTAVDAAVDPAAWKANPKQANTQANKQINITSNVKAAASPVIDKSFLAPFHNLVQASKQTI
jgi:hypothetical protein